MAIEYKMLTEKELNTFINMRIIKSEFYHCILYIFPVNPENHYFDCFSATKNNQNNGFSVYKY